MLTMRDGTQAFKSGQYYIRKSYKGKLSHKEWDRVEYYDTNRNYIPLASTECEKCGEIIQSQYAGHFVTCKCGHTSVDTNRHNPNIHRFLTY